MKKAQALKFWHDLQDNTKGENVIKLRADRRGYGSKRTLQRFEQADSAFSAGDSDEDVAAKTGWNVASVQKIRGWWKSEFKTPPKQTSGGQELEGRPEQEKREWGSKVLSHRGFSAHCRKMAEAAEAIASNMEKLLDLSAHYLTPKVYGNIIDGGAIRDMLFQRPGKVTPVQAEHEEKLDKLGAELFCHGKMDYSRYVDRDELDKPLRQRRSQLEEVDKYQAEYLLEHFNHQFPGPGCYKDWREAHPENIKPETVERLRLCADSRAFQPCPNCPVCVQIERVV